MKLVDTAVTRPVTIWMFTLGILLFGLVAAGRLAVNLLPDLSYPSLTIRTEFVGAAPAEVEQLVSKPIEEAIGIVKGVRKVQSVSRSGRSDVVMEFEWGTDMDIAALEVREKLDVLFLPLEIEKPLLLRFNPNLDPIVRFALSREATEGAALNPAQLVSLRTFAEEDLRRRLESLPGVAAVRPDGGLSQEIQILVDAEKLSQLQLDISQISERLRQENINQSGGRLETSSYDYLVRTINQFADLKQIEDLYIAQVGDSQIRLKDVAEVRDSFVDRQSITYVDGKEAIEVAIYKEGDANTVQVAKNLIGQLDTLKKSLPAGYTLTLVYDQSEFIEQAINDVKSAALVGGLLAMLVLYLFLRNIWATLIISISIPVSVIATFNLMYGQGITLNMMSLGGIALAVGLLVDNAIVVLENIARHKEQGKDPFTAAKIGTSEVAMAITASTLTTVAVFFPLVFVEGIAGQLFRDQALTVTFALLASLVVALTLIPTMAAREGRVAAHDNFTPPVADVKTPKRWYYWLTWPFVMIGRGIRGIFLLLLSAFTLVFRLISRLLSLIFKPVLNIVQWMLQLLERVYRRALQAALAAKALTITLTLVIAAGCFSLLPRLGADVIPAMSQGEFYVEVQLPVGSAIEQTDELLKALAGIAAEQSIVKRSYAQAGTGAQMTVDPSIGGSHWGRLNIVLASEATDADEQQLISLLRDYLAAKPDVLVKIDRPQLFSFSTPLEIELSGYELKQLKTAADAMVNALEAEPGFSDVKTSLRQGQPEITLYFNHDLLSQLGMTSHDVAKRVAAYIGGEVAGQYSVNDRKVDIRVRLSEQYRQSEQQLAQLIINPGSDKPLPLSAVAEIQRETGPSEITRIGQQRVAVVSANLASGDLEQATALAKRILAQQSMPYGVTAAVMGQSEEMHRAYTSLTMALLLAVFLVYLVMASQFENLLQPLLILFTVPLAGAGAVLGLWLTDTRLSVIVFIGLIMLAGIVVNNAIVLIDRINQLRGEGIALTQAIIEAGASRLRPVLMTTLTTVLGLLPMAIGGGDGSEIRAPMAITVIFGLTLATLLTLLFIPVLYGLVSRDTIAARTETSAGAVNAETSL